MKNRYSISKFKQKRPARLGALHGIKFFFRSENSLNFLSHPVEKHPALTRRDKVK
jgi:hypothetical protein